MKRQINKSIIENLTNSNLWKKHLNDDCLCKKVFLAIRNDVIDFYHKGGRLFEFDKNGFTTHKKYASVIEWKSNYLKEKDLPSLKIIPDFESGYSQIKENCSNYSGNEAIGVSDIYHKYSYLSKSNIVVLDIEISFESINESGRQDRIDILLFNKETKTLQFVEAKHFSNPEIWSESKPAVIKQIEGYEKQIEQKEKKIITEFANYIQDINTLFNISLPKPVKIEKEVTLLVFGFDKDQKSGRLDKLNLKNSKDKEIKKYLIGNIKKLVIENLWNTKM